MVIPLFLSLLSSADAVRVDGGPLLDSWDLSDPAGDPENEVVCFSWEDQEYHYIEKITEEDIENGSFDGTKFSCQGEDGPLEIEFFKLVPVAV